MKQLTVIKYTFEPYFSGYFMNGDFYNGGGRLIPQKYYNGRVCINTNGKRYGLKKLRQVAKRVEVVEEILPF